MNTIVVFVDAYTTTTACPAAFESCEITTVTTQSRPDAFPSALWQRRKAQTKTHQGEALLKVIRWTIGLLLQA
jgi:hypothetical protein